jgi:hypothetical protein
MDYQLIDSLPGAEREILTIPHKHDFDNRSNKMFEPFNAGPQNSPILGD